VQITCGRFHSMCLTDGMAVYSWGEGSFGRLGHGDDADQRTPRIIYQLSQRHPVFISAGESHSAAITASHELFTWGNGGFGRLGHGGDAQKAAVPTRVERMRGKHVVAVSCGSFHTIAVTKDGATYTFGQNKYHKLGLHFSRSDPRQPKDEPVKIAMYAAHGETTSEISKDSGAKIIQVSASYNHSLALAKSGKGYSWGYQGRGVLGRATRSGDYPGIALPIGTGKGHEIRICVDRDFLEKNIKAAYDVTAKKDEAEVAADDLPDVRVTELVAGAVNTVALTNTGDVYVLGDNTYHQHAVEELEDPGRGAYGRYATPSRIRLPIADKVTYVACGSYHLLARTGLDEIYGWGRADEGQLGIGYLSEKITEPVQIKDLSFQSVTQICCGDNFSAALTNKGRIHVAGSLDSGKLGLGKGLKRGYQLNFREIRHVVGEAAKPGDLAPAPEFEYIACGVQHMLAIARYKGEDVKNSGTTYAWGKNFRGQLGLGNKAN
jgi:alpha-tubulin suppressor-like RCC1 family protein